MDGPVRTYYRAIDNHEYDALRSLLASDFTHDRPDRTIDGRDTFVRFMREQRPETDTTHEITDMFENDHAIAVQGKLVRAGGKPWFEFVDVFSVEDETIVSLKTYTSKNIK